RSSSTPTWSMRRPLSRHHKRNRWLRLQRGRGESSAIAHPRCVTALEMTGAAKPGAAQNLQGVRAAGADVAVQHHVLIARDGIETALDLPQRNVARAFDVTGAPFVRFADVNHQRVV